MFDWSSKQVSQANSLRPNCLDSNAHDGAAEARANQNKRPAIVPPKVQNFCLPVVTTSYPVRHQKPSPAPFGKLPHCSTTWLPEVVLPNVHMFTARIQALSAKAPTTNGQILEWPRLSIQKGLPPQLAEPSKNPSWNNAYLPETSKRLQCLQFP